MKERKRLKLLTFNLNNQAILEIITVLLFNQHDLLITMLWYIAIILLWILGCDKFKADVVSWTVYRFIFQAFCLSCLIFCCNVKVIGDVDDCIEMIYCWERQFWMVVLHVHLHWTNRQDCLNKEPLTLYRISTTHIWITWIVVWTHGCKKILHGDDFKNQICFMTF